LEQVERKSFTVNAEDTEELFSRLLGLMGFTRAKFASYMGVEVEELDDPPKWAIIYLGDLLDAHLVHLGYVAKDAKHEGAFGEYREAMQELEEVQNERGDTQPPIIIQEGYILSPVRTLRVSLLTNSQNLIKNYIESLG
jgi:hypothetical protein